MNKSTKSFPKKLIMGLGVTALLTSSLFAYNNQSGMKQGYKQSSGHHKMMMKQANHHKKDGKIMSMVKMLDLTTKQKEQIKAIMSENMKNLPNPHKAFSDSGFDKSKYIKMANDRKDNKVERKAETISKIYEVLNSSQKKDLKTMLDMKDMMKQKKMNQTKMMQKGACGGQNCNGRR